MALPKVYIETSIPSFYREIRTDAESLARKNWTQHWWDFKRVNFDSYISEVVLEELGRGSYPTKRETLALVENLPILAVESRILAIVETYIHNQIMPADPVGDALHLAIASYHRCDILLTWNCKHLANAHKFRDIRRLNVMMDLHVPNLVTPLELLEEAP
jgi:hypothetical protein